MKYNYKRTRTPANIFALMMMLALWLPSNAQDAEVVVPFLQRTSTYTPTTKIYNIKGDFQMIGNTNLTSPGQVDNGNVTMSYVDIDGIPNTFNSSSATLALPIENEMMPECSNIIYAGLYWIGRAHDGGTSSPNTFTVTKDVPGTTPAPLNYNFQVNDGHTIQYTDYSMDLTAQIYLVTT